jgi:predicted amidohydrolase
MSRLTIAVIQMEVCSGAVRKNWVRTEARLADAVHQGAQAILLPELWTTGYAWSEMDQLAEPPNGPTLQWLQRCAARFGVTLVGGSFAERRADGRIYNTSYTIGPDGQVLGRYAKQHLFPLLDEPRYMAPGDPPAAIDTPHGRWATIICFDLRFPDGPRTVAQAGAQVLWVPAEWPHPRLEHWRTLLRARAIEDQMFVVAANRVGHGDGNHWCGHAQVIDPWGVVLEEAGEQEATLIARLDLSLVAEVRRRIPVLDALPAPVPIQADAVALVVS